MFFKLPKTVQKHSNVLIRQREIRFYPSKATHDLLNEGKR